MSLQIRHRVGLSRRYFHALNRGAHRGPIFQGDADRQVFVRLLGHFALKYQVPIVAWCLMPNHYHLLPDSDGTTLSRMMHDLDGTYAQIYNERHNTTGCLFEGPYKTMAVIELGGLAYLSRYIHQNPHSLREPIERFPWSSCASYLGSAPAQPWLNPQPVLEHLALKLGLPPQEAYLRYLTASRPPRPKGSPAPGDGDDLAFEYLRYVEERYIERIGRNVERLRDVPLRLLVAWAAIRNFRVPARTAAAYCGFPNVNTLRVAVHRFQKSLDADPGLAELLVFERSE